MAPWPQGPGQNSLRWTFRPEEVERGDPLAYSQGCIFPLRLLRFRVQVRIEVEYTVTRTLALSQLFYWLCLYRPTFIQYSRRVPRYSLPRQPRALATLYNATAFSC